MIDNDLIQEISVVYQVLIEEFQTVLLELFRVVQPEVARFVEPLDLLLGAELALTSRPKSMLDYSTETALVSVPNNAATAKMLTANFF